MPKKDTYQQTAKKLNRLAPSLKSLHQLKKHLTLAQKAVDNLQTYCTKRKKAIQKKCSHTYSDGASALHLGIFSCECQICGWDDY